MNNKAKIKIIQLYAWICILTSSRKKQIKIEHELNGWDWPFWYFGEYFYTLRDFSHDKSEFTKSVFMNSFSNYLRDTIPLYDQLYYHNVEYRRAMTPEEYDQWFNEHKRNWPNITQSKRRYKGW